MIKLTCLEKIYRTENIETTALSSVNLEISSGELIAITGPSGCGKSTLLNILGMIDKPDQGEFYFKGTDIAGFTEKQRTGLRKKNVGYVFQSFNLVNELTVFENIELPLLYSGVGKNERKEKIKTLLERMNISHRIHHYPQQLSGGQQQRVAIARAISNDPAILLADEPTGNLDSKNGDEVMQLLLQLNAAGTTVIMVTHSENYAHFCKRVIRLLDGTIVAENQNEEIHA